MMMMMADVFFETLVYLLLAQENFIEFSRCECFKLYMAVKYCI